MGDFLQEESAKRKQDLENNQRTRHMAQNKRTASPSHVHNSNSRALGAQDFYSVDEKPGRGGQPPIKRLWAKKMEEWHENVPEQIPVGYKVRRYVHHTNGPLEDVCWLYSFARRGWMEGRQSIRISMFLKPPTKQ